MNKICFILLFAVLICTNLYCDGNDNEQKIYENFAGANVYYQKGEYSEAIREYQLVLNEGYISGNLYFNLGNAYLKEGNLGKAILYYEKSKILIPRDADLEVNYLFASDMVQGRVVSKKNMWHWKPLRVYVNYFTINELTLTCSGIFVILMFFVFLSDKIKIFSKYKKIFILVISIFLFLNCFIVYHRVNIIRKTAIVMTSNAEVFFGPYDIATKFFTLQEGMKILVVENQNGWSKVRRVDGKIGWIKTDSIEKVL